MATATELEARMAELAKRVQALEDREAIRECLARYCFNADLGRVDEYADTFAPDGYLEMEGRRFEGREGLKDMFAGSGLHTTIMNRSTHNILNPFIRVDGDKAWAEFYQIVFVKDRDRDERIIRFMGYGHATFVKIDGQWRIHTRTRREVGGPEWGGKVIRDYLNAK